MFLFFLRTLLSCNFNNYFVAIKLNDIVINPARKLRLNLFILFICLCYLFYFFCEYKNYFCYSKLVGRKFSLFFLLQWPMGSSDLRVLVLLDRIDFVIKFDFFFLWDD